VHGPNKTWHTRKQDVCRILNR